MRSYYSHKLLGLVAVVVVALSGLGFQYFTHEELTAQIEEIVTFDAPSVTGFAAFEKNFYPYVKDKCAKCHNDVQSPFFAVDDIKEAYATSKTLVDFSDVGSSVFLERVTNGHCGNNCKTDGKDMLGILFAWKDGEDGPVVPDLPPMQVTTEAAVIPKDITSPVTLRWQIKKFGDGTETADTFAEVNVVKFGEDSYLFQRPRVASQSFNLNVAGLVIYLNGKVLGSQLRFKTLDATVKKRASAAPGLMGFPVLSVRNEIVLKDKGPGVDQIQLGFIKFQKTDTPRTCKSLDKFQDLVLSVAENRNCIYCHGATTPGSVVQKLGKSRLDMSVANADVCAEFLERANLTTPMESPFFILPLGQTQTHPRILPNESEAYPNWITWLMSEVGT